MNFVGRNTMIKASIDPISNHLMYTLKLPVGVTKVIDKMQRDFLWEDVNGHRKIHPIAWTTLFRPIHLGGLGIRDLSSNNLAFLAKMAWRIYSNMDSSLGKLLVRALIGRNRMR